MTATILDGRATRAAIFGQAELLAVIDELNAIPAVRAVSSGQASPERMNARWMTSLAMPVDNVVEAAGRRVAAGH
jgi:hypothetical protein